MGKRRKYTEEFKREAVRQLETRGDRPVSALAESLGIAENLLYSWRARYVDVSAAVRSELMVLAAKSLQLLLRRFASLRANCCGNINVPRPPRVEQIFGDTQAFCQRADRAVASRFKLPNSLTLELFRVLSSFAHFDLDSRG